MLETGASNIVGHDWHAKLDKVFIENLGKFRKYDGKSVQDLLRALRNKVSFSCVSFTRSGVLIHDVDTSETPLSRPP